jgi:hypothetical protein
VRVRSSKRIDPENVTRRIERIVARDESLKIPKRMMKKDNPLETMSCLYLKFS